MACGGVVPSSGVRTGLSLAREDSWSRRCEELSMLRLQLSEARRGIGIGVSACLRSFNPSQWQYAWNSTIPVPNNGFPDLFGRLYSLILIAGMVSRPSIDFALQRLQQLVQGGEWERQTPLGVTRMRW
ncbi:unnamed protein product [Brassica oleracea var. botrytis]|uniref:Uncharacterized protein n=1 Tax=Brassica cretica TaxID=69181 RepID=A0A8S9NXP1_BRACR|nr:hypothetical protein F2Q69_00007524 [Brassica cretica]